jgi:endonuclease/exonuclease/phosphatase family metal-dependent hydrolase
MHRRRYLIENLARYPGLAELKASAFYRQCRGEIESILSTAVIIEQPGMSPRLRSFLRVAQWNIEKGIQLQAVIERLQEDEHLRWADLIFLNEVDFGMTRSGNVHVGMVIAERLGMSLAFAPAHIELTKGTGDDLRRPGENRDSLQGNAILTRHRILETRVVPLPACFDQYEFHEKRYGRRTCLWARLGVATGELWAGAVHLEVRNTPRCRARQLGAILDRLPGDFRHPYLLGGDLNTSGFARRTRFDALQSLWRIISKAPAEVEQELRRPQPREHLFQRASEAGWRWDGLNAPDSTACTPLGSLEEASLLPAFVVRRVLRRLSPFAGHLNLKLDWFLGRGVQPLKCGELAEAAAGVRSADPGVVATPRKGAGRISDHSPIYLDLRLPGAHRA